MNRHITPRLSEIASFVHRGASVIDVGSDHAYIPIYLIQEGKACRALCTDIHDGPLSRSEKNIKAFGFSDVISVQKADGLIGVNTDEYDTIIIAGMGGMLITDILQKANNLSDKHLILQPMTAISELREYLVLNAYSILRESIVREEDKLYIVIEAVVGKEERPYSDAEFLLGRETRQSMLYSALYSDVSGKLKKRLLGLRSAKIPFEAEIKRIESLLCEMEALAP